MSHRLHIDFTTAEALLEFVDELYERRLLNRPAGAMFMDSVHERAASVKVLLRDRNEDGRFLRREDTP